MPLFFIVFLVACWPNRLLRDFNMINVTPVILCGGRGTRLWPLSRTGFPKQFLCLNGDRSLFQLAAQRLDCLSNYSSQICVAAPITVSGDEHRFLIAEQLREVGIELGTALLEPTGRNTAPALTLAALAAIDAGEDPVLVVTPADQIIVDQAAFAGAVQQAINAADDGNIVILGITPNRPETGYGYIQALSGDEVQGEGGGGVIDVLSFVEKPDSCTAQTYLSEGCYFWNAGLFVLKASVWLGALEHFCPDIIKATRAAWDKRTADALFCRPSRMEFNAIPSESIDCAVMEKCPKSSFPIKMVPLAAGWSDLGAWDAVWNALPKDDLGNVHQGDVLSVDSRNTLVQAASRLVSLVGVEDMIVIETADAVLVANKSHSQNVKKIVSALRQSKRPEDALHRKVHRPWGWYDSIDQGDRFKVKRILVKPNASLSLQKHHHRAEHWIVVKGTAEVTCGNNKFLLSENMSSYIPIGEIHRLHNPGSIDLEMIEVQSGSYLGEDDIVRIGDVYGRV